ncbi:MAG: hypothetical protein KDI79_30695 [Anaerolineae bacterium]|nr:hypothetical protein [Anaerolineae bacterium]
MSTQVKQQRQITIEFKVAPEAKPKFSMTPERWVDLLSGSRPATINTTAETEETVYPYTPIRFTVEGYAYSPVDFTPEHWINLLSIGQAGNGTSQTEVEAPAKPKFSMTPERWVELLSGSRPAKF